MIFVSFVLKLDPKSSKGIDFIEIVEGRTGHCYLVIIVIMCAILTQLLLRRNPIKKLHISYNARSDEEGVFWQQQ